MTTKIWSAACFQQVVDALADLDIQVVQIGAARAGHQHPRLKRVLSFVGPTGLHDVLWLIYHAEGVISPVSFPMHVAAAFDKPCVVIAGGREPYWWEAYVNSRESTFGTQCERVRVPHQFLHTIGQLHCCENGGCWKAKVNSSEGPPESVCLEPVDDGHGQIIPACLGTIKPGMVVDAVLGYYGAGMAPAGPATSSVLPQRMQNDSDAPLHLGFGREATAAFTHRLEKRSRR